MYCQIQKDIYVLSALSRRGQAAPSLPTLIKCVEKELSPVATSHFRLRFPNCKAFSMSKQARQALRLLNAEKHTHEQDVATRFNCEFQKF